MDPISNVDQLVLILRQRLAERGAPERSSKSAARSRTSPAGLQALAALGDLDERQFRRALIQNLLTERLGRRLVNSAGFQQVVDQVLDAIERDEAAVQLLARVSADLRAAAP